MELKFDEAMAQFNKKFIDGSFFMQENNGTNEIFIFCTLKTDVAGPVSVSSINSWKVTTFKNQCVSTGTNSTFPQK
jgi:hypothetical protein